MPPKKAAVAPAEGVDGTAAGAIAALVSHPDAYMYLFLNILECHRLEKFGIMAMRVDRVIGIPER